MAIRSNKILYFIQLPPPVHGVSIMNQQVFESNIINKGLTKKLIRINYSTRIDQLRKFSIRKIGIHISLFFRLLYALIAFRPGIVYFSFMPVGIGFYRDLSFLLLIKLFRTKPVLHLHNRGIKEASINRSKKWMYNLAFNGIHIIHLSEQLINDEFSTLNLKNTRLYVVANGIEILDGHKIKKSVNNKTISVLFFSNLIEEKGFFLILEVFRNLLKKYPSLRLKLAGGAFNNNDRKLRTLLASDSLLRGRTHYVGELFGSAKSRLFSDSDIFVFPSYFQEECFPLVILEAMAFGLPIVATSIGAVPEIIEPNINGLLVQPKNSSELYVSLEQLITDGALRLSMSKNNYQKFMANYTSEIFQNRMLNVFTAVLNT